MTDALLYGLTAKARQLYNFIAHYHGARGLMPSFAEMATAAGLKSKSGVHRLLTQLEERGYVYRLPNRARALALGRPGPAAAAPTGRAEPTIALPSWLNAALSADAARHGVTPDAWAADILRFCLEEDEASARERTPSAAVAPPSA